MLPASQKQPVSTPAQLAVTSSGGPSPLSGFRFQVIGQEPALLKRLAPAQEAKRPLSPSPTPSPPRSPKMGSIPTGRLSLLAILGNGADGTASSIPMQVDEPASQITADVDKGDHPGGDQNSITPSQSAPVAQVPPQMGQAAVASPPAGVGGGIVSGTADPSLSVGPSAGASGSQVPATAPIAPIAPIAIAAASPAVGAPSPLLSVLATASYLPGTDAALHPAAPASADPYALLAQVAQERADWEDIRSLKDRLREEHDELLARSEETIRVAQREKEQAQRVASIAESAFDKLEALRMRQEQRLVSEKERILAEVRRLFEEKQQAHSQTSLEAQRAAEAEKLEAVRRTKANAEAEAEQERRRLADAEKEQQLVEARRLAEEQERLQAEELQRAADEAGRLQQEREAEAKKQRLLEARLKAEEEAREAERKRQAEAVAREADERRRLAEAESLQAERRRQVQEDKEKAAAEARERIMAERRADALAKRLEKEKSALSPPPAVEKKASSSATAQTGPHTTSNSLAKPQSLLQIDTAGSSSAAQSRPLSSGGVKLKNTSLVSQGSPVTTLPIKTPFPVAESKTKKGKNKPGTNQSATPAQISVAKGGTTPQQARKVSGSGSKKNSPSTNSSPVGSGPSHPTSSKGAGSSVARTDTKVSVSQTPKRSSSVKQEVTTPSVPKTLKPSPSATPVLPKREQSLDYVDAPTQEAKPEVSTTGTRSQVPPRFSRGDAVPDPYGPAHAADRGEASTSLAPRVQTLSTSRTAELIPAAPPGMRPPDATATASVYSAASQSSSYSARVPDDLTRGSLMYPPDPVDGADDLHAWNVAPRPDDIPHEDESSFRRDEDMQETRRDFTDSRQAYSYHSPPARYERLYDHYSPEPTHSVPRHDASPPHLRKRPRDDEPVYAPRQAGLYENGRYNDELPPPPRRQRLSPPDNASHRMTPPERRPERYDRSRSPPPAAWARDPQQSYLAAYPAGPSAITRATPEFYRMNHEDWDTAASYPASSYSSEHDRRRVVSGPSTTARQAQPPPDPPAEQGPGLLSRMSDPRQRRPSGRGARVGNGNDRGGNGWQDNAQGPPPPQRAQRGGPSRARGGNAGTPRGGPRPRDLASRMSSGKGLEARLS